MPSGAKKRKAAKKKKIQQTSSAHSHGEGEVKHYDEKEIDGGEGSCPASEEQHESGHPVVEVEENDSGKIEGDSSARLIAPESNSVEKVSDGEDVQKVCAKEEKSVEVDWEVKLEEDYKSKDISIESIKEEVHNEVSSRSSSSSSSSDDESLAVENKTEVVQTRQAADSVETLPEVVAQLIESVKVEETDDKVVEICPPVHPVKLDSSLSDMVNQVNDIVLAREIDDRAVEAEHIDSLKPTDCSSEVVNDNIIIGETSNGYGETASSIETKKEPFIEQKVQVIETASNVNPDTSCVVELDPQETEEKKMVTVDNNNAVSPDLVNLGSRERELSSLEKAAVYTDEKDSSTALKEDKLELSYNSPIGNISSGAEVVADYHNPEYSTSQPVVASRTQTVQRTSIKSCCGIFELFTSSDK